MRPLRQRNGSHENVSPPRIKPAEGFLFGTAEREFRKFARRASDAHATFTMKATKQLEGIKNGQGYTSRLVNLLGRDPTADLHSAGRKLEEEFRRNPEEAEGKTEGKGTASGKVV